MLWSTRRQGDPLAVGHRMEADGHGRPTSPMCGCSTEGLWFRRDHEWERVPMAQRCPDCAAGPSHHPLAPADRHGGL
jgi:hypothetical protein